MVISCTYHPIDQLLCPTDKSGYEQLDIHFSESISLHEHELEEKYVIRYNCLTIIELHQCWLVWNVVKTLMIDWNNIEKHKGS